MTRAQGFALLAGVLAAVALAYFALMAARPAPLARVLLRRGYAARGWTEERLAGRIRVLGVAGAVVALAALGLAVVRVLG